MENVDIFIYSKQEVGVDHGKGRKSSSSTLTRGWHPPIHLVSWKAPMLSSPLTDEHMFLKNRSSVWLLFLIMGEWMRNERQTEAKGIIFAKTLWNQWLNSSTEQGIDDPPLARIRSLAKGSWLCMSHALSCSGCYRTKETYEKLSLRGLVTYTLEREGKCSSHQTSIQKSRVAHW